MKRSPYITCRELIDFLYLYLEGELPPDRVEEFERHLGVCASCVEYIASYRAAAALGKATLVPSDEPCEAVPEDLVAAILSVSRSER